MAKLKMTPSRIVIKCGNRIIHIYQPTDRKANDGSRCSDRRRK